jgi:hypothetical protein
VRCWSTAAALHKVFPGQISRAVGKIRDSHASMLETAESLAEEGQLLKFSAHQVAKNLVGDKRVIDAQPGQAYDGWIVASTPGFLIQKVGRSAVVHDLGRFDAIPKANSAVQISYPQLGDKAVVSESALVERRQGIER